MKRFGIFVFFVVSLSTVLSTAVSAQTYVKLNALYALAGVVNPAVEFRLSPKSTFQSEIVYSPWRSIRDHGVSKPMHFGIFMNEYRRYFKTHNRGWYLGANMGMMAFKMSKPEIRGGKIRLESRYSKGYGLMVGLCGGYEYVFRERWILDAYFGWAYMASWYNGYALDGTLDMNPHRSFQIYPSDPFNGSAEWYPNKVGLSIGLLIFKGKR